MFSKLKLFKKLYCGKNCLYGTRTTFKAINEITRDENLTTEIIRNLFEECPTKFPGDIMSVKHYLLKKKWVIINEIYATYYVIKKNPKSTFRYLGYLVKEIKDINNTHKFYMHPTITTKCNMDKVREIWAIDSNWNTIQEFKTFDEADQYWNNKPNDAIQVLFREDIDKPVKILYSI